MEETGLLLLTIMGLSRMSNLQKNVYVAKR